MGARADDAHVITLFKRKDGSHITIFTVICDPVFPSNLNLHSHANLADHIAAVFPDHDLTQLSDDQFIVESLHPPIPSKPPPAPFTMCE